MDLLGALANYEKRLSFVMSVRPFTSNNSAPTGWIFMKFDIWLSSENLSGNSNFITIYVTRTTGTLCEDM
jgi:hypothetical protein